MGTHYDGTPKERRALDAFIKLSRAHATVRSTVARYLDAIGMPEGHLAVLELLLHRGPCIQNTIGEKLLMSRANVTLIVDRLESAGLVERRRGSDDRRCVHVGLTRDGRRRIEDVFPGHVAAIVDAFAALGANEQKQLGALCRKLGRSLSEAR